MIRTGGPSRPADAKVAIVATAGSMVGKRFRVVASDGRTVLTAKVTSAPGASSPWKHAGRADLSPVRAPGSYTVRIGKLRSRPWVVADDAVQGPIATMLQFFAAQSDGNEPSPLHGPSHLNDAQVASGPYTGQHFDLTGGWMDGGDMVKYTQTTAYAVALLQAAARLDPAQADALDGAADVGVRWLVKAHPRPDLFIGQVGDARGRALGFRDPAGDDALADPGIGTRLAYPSTGSDLAGQAAVALAMAAQRSTGDAHDLLLQQARDWYAAGAQTAAVAAPPDGAYADRDWTDDMAAGAVELYRATGEQHYLDEAWNYLTGAPLDGAFTWDEFAGFAVAEICGTLGAPGVQPDRCAIAEANASQPPAPGDAFGMPAQFGRGTTAASAAMGIGRALTWDPAHAAAGAAIAADARDYLLGRNAWGASFVVGYGPRSPRHPYSWASVFGPAKPVGGVVGGPAPAKTIAGQRLKLRHNVYNRAGAVYTDDVQDYVTSEPTIDRTAASILLFATLGR